MNQYIEAGHTAQRARAEQLAQDVAAIRASVSKDDWDELLTPSEVANLFKVDPKTVTRWAKAGQLSAVRTLGGHRRYRAAEVHALLRGLR